MRIRLQTSIRILNLTMSFQAMSTVEPQPEIYARLAALSAFMRDGLKSRDMLSAHNEDLLTILEQLSRQLLAIAVKELENQPLTDEEYELIRTIGGQLEHIWYETQINGAIGSGLKVA